MEKENAKAPASKLEFVTPSAGFDRAILLPKSGKVFSVRTPLGEDSIDATRLTEGDTSLYVVCLASVIGVIDGTRVLPDALKKLHAKDYHAIVQLVGEEAF